MYLTKESCSNECGCESSLRNGCKVRRWSWLHNKIWRPVFLIDQIEIFDWWNAFERVYDWSIAYQVWYHNIGWGSWENSINRYSFRTPQIDFTEKKRLENCCDECYHECRKILAIFHRCSSAWHSRKNVSRWNILHP